MDYTILLVDDNPSSIDMLKSILQDAYTIKIATSGKTTFKILKDNIPDLILLDIIMPDMDGLEICNILKSCVRTKDIPVIFVTELSDVHDECEGFKLGSVDYITKPINAAIVKARVKTHLSLAYQQKELDLQIREKTKELHNSRIDLLTQLGLAAEYKDNETGNHTLRVAKYCKIIAEKYGFSIEDLNLLILAAPMHDIGKIAIEDKILNKPGKLSPKEWIKMKEHTTIGAKILGDFDDPLLKLARSIVLLHHEKWDGTGYPNGFKGIQICINARILSIADVFDALTHKRSYKEAWTFEDSFEYIISQQGLHFDPELVKVFCELKDEVFSIYNEYKE